MVATPTVTVAIGAGLVGLCGLGSLLLWRRRRRRRTGTGDRRALARALEERLAETMGPGTGTHLERAPRVRRLAAIDAAELRSASSRTQSGDTGEPGPRTNADGDARSVLVPIVRVDLGTTDAPRPKLLFEYVAAVLEAIHPVLDEREERVHCYDVEFAFGPNGLLVDGECRRVSVTPELADRLCEDDEFRTVDLRRADGDDETPTTAWGDCRDASRWQRADDTGDP